MFSFFKGWRTRLFGLAVMALGILEVAAPTVWAEAFGANRAMMTLVIGAAIILLRQMTTTPPGKKA